jgi:hypothetical protein
MVEGEGVPFVQGFRGLYRLVAEYGRVRPSFQPTYPDFLHGAPLIPACAAFIKESRTKFANASKVNRKSEYALAKVWDPSCFQRSDSAILLCRFREWAGV